MVDISSEGTYFLAYTVADGSGVPAQEVRTVHVAPPEQIQQEQDSWQEAVPEPEPEQTEPEEKAPRGLPAIVQRYDSNGSGIIEQGEWEAAIADYTAYKLTTPQIQTIAAHRG